MGNRSSARGLNIAAVHEAITEAVPDRECIVWRDRRLTWDVVTRRTRQLANGLLDRGVGGSPRVVAVVAGTTDLDADRLHRSAAEHLARYKLPKDYLVVDVIRRSASGKPDYAWARDVAGAR
ncbi:MAG: hypothetical protein U5K30_00035 [Acidimicrobiales bacterium]|nr:hypothetical protein [Acidimicrobiales bacterium]